MKKLVGSLLTLFIIGGNFSLIQAAPTDTTEITTKDLTGSGEGSVWASIDGTPLAQMKVTVPIKIEFEVVKEAGTSSSSNKVVIGSGYEFATTGSEVDVSLTGIEITPETGWALTDSLTGVTDIKKIMLNMAGKQLVGSVNNSITDFDMVKNTKKALPISIDVMQDNFADDKLPAAKAFTVKYYVAQKI